MAVDLSVFERQKSVLDQQQLQEAFNLKKAAMQMQMQKAMQPEQITPYQAATLDLQRQALEQKGSSLPVAEQKIGRLQESLGVDRPTAVGIVDGAIKVVTDPMTNQPFIVNVATGQKSQLNSGAQNIQPNASVPSPVQAPNANVSAPKQPSPSLYDLADDTAGFVPAAKRAYSAVAGQIGLPIATKAIESAQTMEIAKNDLIRALAINPRFAEGELKRLSKEINIAPSMIDSPAAKKARMRSMDLSLTTRLRNAERDAQDATLPLDTRIAQAANASAIRNFLPILNVPDVQTQDTSKPSLSDIFGD